MCQFYQNIFEVDKDYADQSVIKKEVGPKTYEQKTRGFLYNFYDTITNDAKKMPKPTVPDYNDGDDD